MKDRALKKITPKDDRPSATCAAKPRWTCPAARLCLSCHDKMSLQRSLLPSTQAEVNNRMSSVAEDPHETKTPPCEGDDRTWYTAKESKDIQDIALELRVSQSDLIWHNYKNG